MHLAERALCAVIVFVTACGVSGVDQKAELELGVYAADDAGELPAGTGKSEELLIGSRDAHDLVPALLEWEVAKDASGCLRFKKVSLRRTGGPSSVEIYDVKLAISMDGKCVSRLDGSNETFQKLQVSYCWRWNGAVNDAKCAYSGGVSLNADKVGVEGKDRAKPASSTP
jgi:hypothetical protein